MAVFSLLVCEMALREKIKRAMDNHGQKIYIRDEKLQSLPFNAFIQPVRYKNRMYLQDINTVVGLDSKDYFLYIGPYDREIDQTNRNMVIESNSKKYNVVKSQPVHFDDQVVYVWAVIKEFVEDE